MSFQLLQKTRTIACIGRNYAAHIAELANAVPSEPFFFLKPASALTVVEGEVRGEIEIPANIGEVHHEAELAVVIGKTAKRVKASDAMDYIAGYTVSVDVTGRDLQAKSKQAGLPWTRAKGYDTWCPVGSFVDKEMVSNIDDLTVCLSVNGVERQRGSCSLMLFKVPQLLEAVTDVTTPCGMIGIVHPGDLLLTGTPAGVGRLLPGDAVKCWIEGLPCPPLELDVIERK